MPSQARGQGRGQGSPWQKSEAKDPNQGPPPKMAARAFPESAHVFRGKEGGRRGALPHGQWLRPGPPCFLAENPNLTPPWSPRE